MYSSKLPIVEIKPSQVCILGKGGQGKVCLHEASKGRKRYAVKYSFEYGNNLYYHNYYYNVARKNLSARTGKFLKLGEEMEIHAYLWTKAPRYLKRFFIKPVQIKHVNKKETHYGMVALDNAETARVHFLKLIKENKIKKAVQLLRKIRQAIYGMWSMGVIHRDLHLQNILITPKGTPKIIDFGLARYYKPLSKEWKTGGTTMLTNVNKKYTNWLKRFTPFYQGNPNVALFPSGLKRLGMYSTQSKEILKYLYKKSDPFSRKLSGA